MYQLNYLQNLNQIRNWSNMCHNDWNQRNQSPGTFCSDRIASGCNKKNVSLHNSTLKQHNHASIHHQIN